MKWVNAKTVLVAIQLTLCNDIAASVERAWPRQAQQGSFERRKLVPVMTGFQRFTKGAQLAAIEETELRQDSRL